MQIVCVDVSCVATTFLAEGIAPSIANVLYWPGEIMVSNGSWKRLMEMFEAWCKSQIWKNPLHLSWVLKGFGQSLGLNFRFVQNSSLNASNLSPII